MERLYNGIELPDVWPPKSYSMEDRSVRPIPYLIHKPDVIDISVGRQLFVDSFLISSLNGLKVCYHTPVKYENNPIFKPETDIERNETLPCACPKSGGVWYDEYMGKYRMWYEAGWLNKLAYAESDDGFNWVRPELDVVECTNLVLPGVVNDSSTVFIDYDTKNANERYKLFMRGPGGPKGGFAYTSPDGIHWAEGRETSIVQDRSTVFYNPFRKKWVYSIRDFTSKTVGRVRAYRECDDYLEGAVWNEDERVFWMGTDELDLPDTDIGCVPQLYNFDCKAYESIMLGMFQIWYGPENKVCAQTGIPKITELQMSYSRDGFHFSRPVRNPFIPATRKENSWDRGYVQSVGGVCIVRDENILFYYIGFKGDEGRTFPSGKLSGMHDNSATGIAILRRDGFASLNGDGFVLTEKLTMSKKKARLYVNFKGTCYAEILDGDNDVISGYSKESCISVKGDLTKAAIVWYDKDVFEPAENVFRLRIFIEDGELYSFWFE